MTVSTKICTVDARSEPEFFFCFSLTTLRSVISESDTVGKSALTGTLAVHASEDHRKTEMLLEYSKLMTSPILAVYCILIHTQILKYKMYDMYK